jgi:Flp pilus assembly protein TadG
MLSHKPGHKLGQKTPRRGMTTVETALVLTVFCMLLFGVFEYTRFLFVLHVTNNATRDGSRYAAVNLNMPTSFSNTDYTDASGNVYPNIQRYTTSLLGGADQQISGYQVAVYAVDPTGLTLSPPVIRAMTSSTATPAVYPNPFNASDPNAVAWNGTAFPNQIAVTIQGNYTPLLPGFLFMPSSVPLYVTGMASCEG